MFKSIAVLTAALLGLAATNAHAQQPIDRTVQASPDGAVQVRNVVGSVIIDAWDRAQVHVTGTLGTGTLDVTGNGRNVRVVVEVPARQRNIQPTHLHVRVPAGSALEVHTVSSSIEAGGVRGRIDLESVSGNVRYSGQPLAVTVASTSGRVNVEATSDDVEASTTSGDIRIAGATGRVVARSVSGNIHVQGEPTTVRLLTISGNVDVANVRENIEATTTSGDIRVGGNTVRDLRLKSISGAIRYAGGLDAAARLAVETLSGNVQLALAATTSAQFRLNSFSGRIRNALADEVVDARGEMRFTVGAGGAEVAVRTFSGRIELVRR